jgi:hypothetical protein
MSRLLKPSAELPLKLLAFDTIDHRDVPLQLLASILPGTTASTATPLEQAMQRRRAAFAEIDSWHHGGLNE